MMSEDTTTNDDQNQDDSGSETVGAITVNLAETDPKKAVTRASMDSQSTDDDSIADVKKTRNHKDRKDEFAKRIGRLRTEFSQQQADQEARHQRELRELRDDINGLKVSKTNTTLEADEAKHNATLADLEDRLTQALEAGDSTKAAKLQSAISEEHARYFSALAAKRNDVQQQNDKRVDPTRSTQQATNKGPTANGKRFIAKNADWWEDPEFRAEKNETIAIDGDLIREGFDPNSAEHYDEMVYRLSQKFPSLEVVNPFSTRSRRDADDDEDELTRPARTPVRSLSASANRGAAPEGARANGNVRLNRADIANMERFGMDPENPKHVVEYAANKVT